jgi:hypothetical protein
MCVSAGVNFFPEKTKNEASFLRTQPTFGERRKSEGETFA